MVIGTKINGFPNANSRYDRHGEKLKVVEYFDQI